MTESSRTIRTKWTGFAVLLAVLFGLVPASYGECGAQVCLVGLEVTQSIQDMSHSIPLIAHKTTVVRAYFDAPEKIGISGQLIIQRVGQTEKAVRAFNKFEVDPLENGQLRVKRHDIQKSLNFILRSDGSPEDDSIGHPDAIAEGELLFIRLEITSPSDATCDGCSSITPSRVTFLPSAPLRIRLIGITYHRNGNFYYPGFKHFLLARSWLKRAYPVASVQDFSLLGEGDPTIPGSVPYNTSSGDLFSGSGCLHVNAQILAIRQAEVSPRDGEVAGRVDPRTHYHAFVYDGGGDGPNYIRGCPTGFPVETPDPSVISSGPTGENIWSWDKDGSYGDWMSGHEIGHGFGRKHASIVCSDPPDDPDPDNDGFLSPGGGAEPYFVGLDVGDRFLGTGANAPGRRALQGDTWHDVMSYCPQKWVNPGTYAGIWARLLAEQTLVFEDSSTATGSEDAAPLHFAQAGQGVLDASGVPVVKKLPVRNIGQYLNSTPSSPSLPQLISDATQTEPTKGRRPVKPGVRVLRGDLLGVIAIVNLTHPGGEILYVNRLKSANIPVAHESINVQIRLTYADGGVMDHQAVMKQIMAKTGEEDQKALVEAIFPFSDKITKLELVVENMAAHSVAVSEKGPLVKTITRQTITSASASSGDVSKRPLGIAWEGQGLDNPALSQTVQISTDNGPWRTVALAYKARELSIMPELIKGAKTLRVRIVTTDGFHTNETESKPISIKDQ